MEALRSFKTLTAIDSSSMVDKVEISLLDFFAKKESISFSSAFVVA